MFRWADFEAAAPELAAPGRELIERFRFGLVGTILLDGTPRISPGETHIVRAHPPNFTTPTILPFTIGTPLLALVNTFNSDAFTTVICSPLLPSPFQVSRK